MMPPCSASRVPLLSLAGAGLLSLLAAAASPKGERTEAVTVGDKGDFLLIETDKLQAQVNKKGYVSGTARGSLLDKQTGARDVGFGLHIMDFLLSPGWRDDGYQRERKLHGDLPKHYVEGPQICTQAKALKPEIIEGKDFVAVRLRYRYDKPGAGYKAGSVWEQTLLFRTGLRYFLGSERITSVNDVDNLFYRIDMPGHVKHKKGDTFTQIYLSYVAEPIPASAFAEDFGPDEKYLYRRGKDKLPRRMIRAYQVKRD